jgi:hypothetical protein
MSRRKGFYRKKENINIFSCKSTPLGGAARKTLVKTPWLKTPRKKKRALTAFVCKTDCKAPKFLI